MILFKKGLTNNESCVRIHFVVNLCGCGSMVELQPSKLVTWVRFPSPAPKKPDSFFRIRLFVLFYLVIAPPSDRNKS